MAEDLSWREYMETAVLDLGGGEVCEVSTCDSGGRAVFTMTFGCRHEHLANVSVCAVCCSRYLEDPGEPLWCVLCLWADRRADNPGPPHRCQAHLVSTTPL